MPRKSSMKKKAKKSRPSIIHTTLRQGDPYGIFDDDEYVNVTFDSDDDLITGPPDNTSRTSATGGMSTKEELKEVKEVKFEPLKQKTKLNTTLNSVAAAKKLEVGLKSRVAVEAKNTDGKRIKKRSKKSKKHSDGRKRRKSLKRK